MTDWQTYIKSTSNRAPRTLLVKALEYITEKKAALDLGAGALNESKLLIENGFKKVIALDITASPELIKDLDKKVFQFKKTKIEDYIFPENYFDIVNAQFVLPFIEKDKIEKLMFDIKKSLRPGGIFLGQFFGLRDAWKSNPEVSVYSEIKVKEFLFGLEIIYFYEEEKDGQTAAGEAKHWHDFHFICLKK